MTTEYTADSLVAASLIYEDCRARGQSREEGFTKAILRLVPAFGPGVEQAVAAGDYGAAYGLQIDHEMRSRMSACKGSWVPSGGTWEGYVCVKWLCECGAAEQRACPE